MKKSNKQTITKILLISVLITSLYSCSEKVNVTKAVDSTSTPSTTTTTTTTTDTTTNNNGSTTTTTPSEKKYYSFSVIAHGGTPGTVRWSSTTAANMSESQKTLFYTDARLKIRVKPQSSPGQVASDSNGEKCQYMQLPYKKLLITLGVKAQGAASYLETYTFDSSTGTAVGSTSESHYFRVPPNSRPTTAGATGTPFIVEVTEVKWDYSCTVARASQQSILCPWDYVWKYDCFAFDIHMSTDYSDDF